MWMLTKLLSSLKNGTAQNNAFPSTKPGFVIFQILTAQTIFYQDHWITRTPYLQLLDLCSTLLLRISPSLVLPIPSHTNTLTWTPIRSLRHLSHWLTTLITTSHHSPCLYSLLWTTTRCQVMLYHTTLQQLLHLPHPQPPHHLLMLSCPVGIWTCSLQVSNFFLYFRSF